jgi:hypothetical protein
MVPAAAHRASLPGLLMRLIGRLAVWADAEMDELQLGASRSRPIIAGALKIWGLYVYRPVEETLADH